MTDRAAEAARPFGTDVPAGTDKAALTQSPFRSRNFRWYWSGGLVSNIGTWLQNVSGSVYVLATTHSTLYVGLLNVATFIPIFLFSVLGGTLADRFDRRMVVIVTAMFSAVVGVAITICSATGTLGPWLLITMAFLIGSSYAINKPAMTAMLPAIVPRNDIAHATAINTLQFNIGQVVGSALSALLLAVTSYTWAFGVNALTFFGPVVAMLMVRLGEAPPRRAAIKGSGREGMRFALHSPAILAILGAIVLSNASAEVLRTLAPAITTRTLHASQSSTGILVTAYSIGGSLGILCFSRLSRRLPGNVLLIAAFVLQAVGLIGSAISRTEWLSAAFAVPIGLGFAFNVPILSAGLQRIAPEEFRGRVMSFFSMAMFGLRPLFSLTAGGLATFMSPSVVLAMFVVFPVVALRLVGKTQRALQQQASKVGAAASAG
jgi:MFS family permease